MVVHISMMPLCPRPLLLRAALLARIELTALVQLWHQARGQGTVGQHLEQFRIQIGSKRCLWVHELLARCLHERGSFVVKSASRAELVTSLRAQGFPAAILLLFHTQYAKLLV
jgi:hypothetical protein